MSTVDSSGPVDFGVREGESLLGERERVAAALFGHAATPKLVGRYRVVDTLGRGAMGVVYEAWDEELQRTVAVKLISREAELGEAEHRFRREALALAKLAHPNVVTVHEVGRLDGRLYIAMELVRGETLGAWLGAKTRTWQEIVAVFVQAGRGLEAAHEAGLVHRDFKPSNCIVGESGRVRVLDFGLARTNAELLEDDVGTTSPMASSLDVSVTRTGATVGTPAYMAPEQLRGGEVSAASDQFSFCVALYEALEGVRPFEGTCIVDIHGSIESGRIQKGSGRTPPDVLRILERGFSVSPSDRWPSLHEVVDALDSLPRRRARRRRIGWMLGATVVTTTAVASAVLPEQPCVDPPQTAVWASPRRASLESAMDGRAGWTTLDAAVTLWSRQWSAAQQRACTAAREDGRTTEGVLARQRACFERRERTVEALLDGLAATEEPALHVGDVVRRLPSLHDCGSADAVLGVEEPPPVSAPDVATARSILDESLSSAATGDLDKASALAETAERLALEIGYAPLQVDVALRRGTLGRQREADGGALHLRDAFKRAESAAYDLAAADAALQLTLVALDRDDPGTARRWREVAEAKLERTAAGPRRRTRLAMADVSLALLMGEGDTALSASAEGLELCAEAAGEDSLLCADVLALRARAVESTRSSDEAEVAHGRALQALRRRLGDAHPSVVVALLNRGLFRIDVGHFDAASADVERALASLEPGMMPRVQAELLLARAQLESMRGRLQLDDLAAVATLLEAYPDDDPQRTEFESVLAAFYLRLNQPQTAFELYERILAAHQRSAAAVPGLVALDHSNLGECLLELGRPGEARARFELALRRLEDELAPDDPRLSYPLTGLGRAQLALGQRPEAHGVLERSLALVQAHPGDVLLAAQTRWALARVLGIDSARGRSLAEASREGFLAASDNDAAQLVVNALGDQHEHEHTH